MRRTLEYQGYQFVGAASGQEGLALIDRDPPDLVFLDIKMPGMDGLEVLDQIKAKHPEVPVVMVSGHGTAQNAFEARDKGASGFIEKPFSEPVLLERIEKELAGNRTETAYRALRQGKVAAFLSVRPRYSFHVVSRDPDGIVTDISDVHGTELWMNGGYFMFRREIFDYIGEGEDLVAEPFQRLIDEDQLLAYRYEGFWMPMDSLKDLQDLQALHDSGAQPWAPWLADTNGRQRPSGRLHLPG